MAEQMDRYWNETDEKYLRARRASSEKERNVMEELTSLAQRALDGDDVLEAVEIFEFSDDQDTHDDALQEKLERQFEAKFDDACRVLTGEIGEPSRTGNADDYAIPVCGVFRFVLWEKAEGGVYLAAAHEDRECPFLILIGNL